MPDKSYIEIAFVFDLLDSVNPHARRVLQLMSAGPRLIKPDQAHEIGDCLAHILTAAARLENQCRNPFRPDSPGAE